MEVKTMSLRRRASVVAAMGFALWSAGSSAAVTLRVDAQPVADPIQVFVNVTSAAGAPVTGLQAGDFAVRVDGTTVSSPTFSLPPASGGGKVSVVLAMDMSQSVQNAALESMQQAVIGFLDSMQNGDYAAIVKFNNTNPDKASLVQDFTPIDGGAGNSALESAVMAPYPGSGSNVLDGVTLAINTLGSPSVALPSGPKAIVLVSDGRDNASTATLDTVVSAATAASIPVFTIGVGDLTTTGGRLLSDLATRTGAEYIPAPDNGDIAEAYARISQRLGNEYVLTFNSSITDCNSHSVQVDVAGNGSATSQFQRCTDSGNPPPPPGGGGDGGGGGGGGGASGLLEVALGLSLVALARRRRFGRNLR
ncbi:MAG TPA: VWA domain-containing protein [Steroidobacteraceae bacterium]|nr:VWA domain-containing protein [Steroidobacteraceae bacterium]